MVTRPPRRRQDQPNSDGTVITPPETLSPHPVLGRHQHIVYNLQTHRAEAGYLTDQQGHLSSNTKIAALAFIARLRGAEYIQQNRVALQRMMSLSHNDATIVQVARAMNHPDAARFQNAFRNLVVDRQGQIRRENENLVANRYPDQTREFFDAYRAALMREQRTLGIQGARIGDTSGRAEPGLHHGTSQASPQHVAQMVDYLYRLDNGRTLSMLGNPANGPHTTASYLRGRDQPGNGQVFFAKTGTLAREEYDKLPQGSGSVRQQNPNGVYVLTVGYMEDGVPKVAFMRTNSETQRRQLANQFLDHVAGVQPQVAQARTRQPRPTSSA